MSRLASQDLERVLAVLRAQAFAAESNDVLFDVQVDEAGNIRSLRYEITLEGVPPELVRDVDPSEC